MKNNNPTKKKKTNKSSPKKKPPIKPAKKPLTKGIKVATITNGIDIIKKENGTYVISGKNANAFEGAIVEQKERDYKFDDRLVPYYIGADSKEANLAIRDALIKLGKTPQMTDLFTAMQNSSIGYDENGKNTFIKTLFSIINGHDQIGLQHIYEDDIQMIHNNNLKLFNDFWDAKPADEDDFSGFSK